jgi:Protein of unknown function (DUF1194)
MTSAQTSIGRNTVLLLGGMILILFAWSSSASAVENVDLKLVLATDASGSSNNDEFRLEREGTAAAFLDPEVIKAIRSGALGRIAVSMLDFSSPGFGKTIIDWRIIHDQASAAAFSQAIRDAPRAFGRRTSVSNALELGSALIESSESDIVATRRVIDVTGDGANNDGNTMQEVHDRVVAQGIVVNGLPVMDESANGYYPNLDKYYQACVVGGRGAFVIVVRSFKDFLPAMRRKLILEISQNEAQIRQALRESKEGGPLRLVQSESNQAPQLLRPGDNEYTNNCDVGGAFNFR